MRHTTRYLKAAIVACSMAIAGVLVPGQAGAATTTIHATVGPGHTITLKTSAGATIRTLTAGRPYNVVVRDRSDIHNFRLTGPGVSRATGVAFTGTTTWKVTFRVGTYSFKCDPHADMRGSFKAS